VLLKRFWLQRCSYKCVVGDKVAKSWVVHPLTVLRGGFKGVLGRLLKRFFFTHGVVNTVF